MLPVHPNVRPGSSLATLAEHLPFDVWARDSEHRCIFANPTALAHWGADPVGKRPEETDLPADVLQAWRVTNDRALAGEVVVDEVRYPHGWFYKIVAPVRDPTAKIVGTVGVNIDITELRRALDALRARESLLGFVVDALPIAFGVRELRGTEIVHVANNRNLSRLLGRNADALVGRTERELGTAPEACERMLSRFLEARRRGEPVPIEFTIATPNGPRALDGRVMLVPASEDSERPEQFAIVAQDVTEVRALQAEVVRADRLASLQTFLATMGHELANPLTYVTANVGFALETVESDKPIDAGDMDELRDSLRAAHGGLQQATAMLKELRFLSTPKDVLEPTDPVKVVESVLVLVERDLRSKALLVRELDRVPPVRATPLRLAQVVLNLLKNAIEMLEPASVEHNVIRLSTERRGDRVRLVVEDNGPGVPPELRDHLFQPFQGQRQGGSGLGLYVCHTIVHSFGGTIHYEPAPRRGTRFVIELLVDGEG